MIRQTILTNSIKWVLAGPNARWDLVAFDAHIEMASTMKPKTPPPTFAVGERVTYYPTRQSRDDNTHFAADVVSLSAKGRPRVKFQIHQIGERLRTVSPRALARQDELPL